MKIKHAVSLETGEEFENQFVAVDDRGVDQGECLVYARFCPALFPARPHQLRIDMEGPREALSALLGAATAHALRLTARENVPARIYTECQPDDTERVVLLNEFGYEDNDGLVRMAHEIVEPPVNPEIPEGLTVLHDFLEDPVEARYFLMRYNRLFSVDEGMEFVGRMVEQPGFRRYLVIAEEGLLGEVLVSLKDETARILFLHVNASYRREGIGTYLMKLAIYSLAQRGARRVEMDVRVRIPGVMRFLNGLGFEQDQLLMRYLGIDWNPGAAEKRLRVQKEHSKEAPEPIASDDFPLKSERPIAQDPEDWD